MTRDDTGPENALPFEPWTALTAVSLRRYSLLVILPLVAVAATVGGWRMIGESHEARTVLLFSPLVGDEVPGLKLPALSSRRHMVKLRPTLEKVIARCGLDALPVQLEAACEAAIQPESNLLAIQVRWSTAAMAARIANDIAEVFQEQQIAMRREAASRLIADLQGRQGRAQQALKNAAETLGQFRLKNNVSNIDDQIRAALADVATLRSSLHEARIDQQNIVLQRKNLVAILKNVRDKVPAGTPGGAPSAIDAQSRLQLLRTSLETDRTERERKTVLERATRELARTERSFAQGLISAAERDRVVTVYERSKQLAGDTPRTREWKTQIEALEKVGAAQAAAPAATGGADVALRVLQVELDAVGIENKVRYLAEALAQAEARQARFPRIQRDLAELQSQVNRQEAELAAVEQPLAQARRVHVSTASDFEVAARAVPLKLPPGYQRSVASAGIGVAAMLAWLALLAGREVMHPRVRSGRELCHLTDLPVWAQLPACDASSGEVYRLSRRIGQEGNGRGARVLVTGAASNDVRRRVVSALLDQFALQGRRVASIFLTDEDNTDQAAREGQLVLRADGGGRHGPKMSELLESVSHQFDALLVVTDGVRAPVDDQALAAACDVIVLIAQADRTSRAEARRMAKIAGVDGTRVAGWVLIDVPDAFASVEAERTW